jgi:hypothetical protein
MERVKGIEPSYSAWKAAALPLSYTRDFNTLVRFRFIVWHDFGTEIMSATRIDNECGGRLQRLGSISP